jgi:hypothetical protein
MGLARSEKNENPIWAIQGGSNIGTVNAPWSFWKYLTVVRKKILILNYSMLRE